MSKAKITCNVICATLEIVSITALLISNKICTNVLNVLSDDKVMSLCKDIDNIRQKVNTDLEKLSDDYTTIAEYNAMHTSDDLATQHKDEVFYADTKRICELIAKFNVACDDALNVCTSYCDKFIAINRKKLMSVTIEALEKYKAVLNTVYTMCDLINAGEEMYGDGGYADPKYLIKELSAAIDGLESIGSKEVKN